MIIFFNIADKKIENAYSKNINTMTSALRRYIDSVNTHSELVDGKLPVSLGYAHVIDINNLFCLDRTDERVANYLNISELCSRIPCDVDTYLTHKLVEYRFPTVLDTMLKGGWKLSPTSIRYAIHEDLELVVLVMVLHYPIITIATLLETYNNTSIKFLQKLHYIGYNFERGDSYTKNVSSITKINTRVFGLEWNDMNTFPFIGKDRRTLMSIYNSQFPEMFMIDAMMFIMTNKNVDWELIDVLHTKYDLVFNEGIANRLISDKKYWEARYVFEHCDTDLQIFMIRCAKLDNTVIKYPIKYYTYYQLRSSKILMRNDNYDNIREYIDRYENGENPGESENSYDYDDENEDKDEDEDDI
jgi:hypothetical protein